MDTYIATRRFFLKGELITPGKEIKLNSADAGRLAFIGAVYGPIPKPKRARKRRKVKNGD